MGLPVAAHQSLRAATAADHERVDAAFGGFALRDRGGYAGFLLAHARALPTVEAALASADRLPPLRPRTPLLIDDLAALGSVLPPPLPIAAPADAAEAFGMAYVIEGSRLGGGLLARQVGDFPAAYLRAVHLPGEWRTFLGLFDAAAVDAGAMRKAWLDRATAAARRTFALYATAAAAR